MWHGRERVVEYLPRVLSDPFDIEVERGVRGRGALGAALGRLGLGGGAEGACGGGGVGERRGDERVDEGTVGGCAELADDEAHLGVGGSLTTDETRSEGEGGSCKYATEGREWPPTWA